MNVPLPLLPRRDAKSRLSVPYLLIALVSIGTIKVLNGHACTGDGCVLCLVAACAHVLLLVSLGAALARPIVRIISELRVTRYLPHIFLELVTSTFVDALEVCGDDPCHHEGEAAHLMEPLLT